MTGRRWTRPGRHDRVEVGRDIAEYVEVCPDTPNQPEDGPRYESQHPAEPYERATRSARCRTGLLVGVKFRTFLARVMV